MNAATTLRSVMLGLAGFCMLLSWLLPNHFRPWVTAYQDLLAAVALVLFAAAVLLGRGARLPTASILIGCLAIIPALQLATGILTFAGDAWVSAAYILALALAVFAGYNLQSAEQGRGVAIFAEYLAWTLLLGAMVSAVLAVMQWLGFTQSFWVSSPPYPTRPFANMAQPNNLATLLGMGLMSLLYLFELRRVHRFPALLLALMLIFALALTQSRTPWITALFVGGFWFWQRRHIELRLECRHMLLWLLIYMAMVVSVPLVTQYLGIGSGSLMDRLQQAARLGMYQQFLHAILEGPWYGYGWDQVFAAQAAVASAQVGHGPSIYTHNVLLDLLIWNGPIIGSLIIVTTGIWFWHLLRGARSLTATYAWLAFSCFLIHSMLEFPHAYLMLLLPAGLLLGLLQASVDAGHMACAVPRLLTAAGVTSAAVLTAFMWQDYRLLEMEFNQAVLEHNEELIPKQQQAISRIRMLTHMREYIYFIRAPLKSDYSDQQLEELLTSARRFPHFFFLLKSAHVMAINDRMEEAHKALLLMGELHKRPGLEQALDYLLMQSEKEPELLILVGRFGKEP